MCAMAYKFDPQSMIHLICWYFLNENNFKQEP